jgi:hypothetical protein
LYKPAIDVNADLNLIDDLVPKAYSNPTPGSIKDKERLLVVYPLFCP